MDASRRSPRRRRSPRALGRLLPVAVLAAVAIACTACGDFSTTSQSYTVQPSLTPAEVTPAVPEPLAPESPPGSSSPPPSSAGPTSGSTKTSAPADPCVPTDPAVIAACLTAPTGLAPLPDGTSALVGERTTGRILKVAAGTKPVVVTTISGIDAKGDGGLLGIAVSPSYVEDGLIYAYITTATDNRVIRIAAGDVPKPILTGIPKGPSNNGGGLAFTPDGVLYIGTGNAGSPAKAANPASLAGKLLRVDDFGKPAAGNPRSTSPIFASGFTQITTICQLPIGSMAALDHRSAADVLLPAKSTKNYTTLQSGDAVWTWKAGDGGAAGCAASDTTLANTSLAKQQLSGVTMTATGAFTGTPRVLLGNKYGRLLTVQPGAKGALWLTTSNKDGHGKPVAADDRVILLPNAGGAGGNGPD
jgi:glucose/arabinose dehydrogenase